MPELAVRLTLLTPAAVGDLRSAGFITRTLRYIPGSVVRGALAQAWLVDHDLQSEREPFLTLFEGQVSFGPLHKNGSLPEPLTRLTHKYEAGEQCPTAYDGFAYTRSSCQKCAGLLQSGKGAIHGVGSTLENHAQLPRGADETPKLFSRERLDRGQVFLGLIGAPDDGTLARVAELIGKGREVWIGGRKSSGGGRARLEVADRPRPVRPTTANGATQLMLTSPGIFVDDYGFPADAPALDELQRTLGQPCTITARMVRWTTVGGWHAASKLPKPVERAVAPGSVFRIRTDRPVDDGALAALQSRGLGLRRTEGFGALSGIPAEPKTQQDLTSTAAALRGLHDKPQLLRVLLAELRAFEAGLNSWASAETPTIDGFIRTAPKHQFEHQFKALDGLRALAAADLGRALTMLEPSLLGGAR